MTELERLTRENELQRKTIESLESQVAMYKESITFWAEACETWKRLAELAKQVCK